MQSLVVMLVLVCAAGGVLSCAPCKCSLGQDEGSWPVFPGLQVARCDDVGLTSVPSTDTLPAHTQVLHIYGGSTIPTIYNDQFVSFPKLLKIYIQNSNVNRVERNAFRNLTNVTTIQLDSNLITELPVGLFSHTPRLVRVSFHSNKLKVLPEALFSNLNDLKVVLLSYNEITSIEANYFVNVPRLEEVYLNDNKLTTLDMKIFNESSSLKVLLLSGNSWHCDESLCGVMAAVVNRGLWTKWFSPYCATPQSLQDKVWTDLKNHALLQQCPPS